MGWTRVTISLIWKTGVSEFVSFQLTILGKEHKFQFECLLPQQAYREPSQYEKALGLGNECKTPTGSSCCLGAFLYVATTKRAGQAEQVSTQMKRDWPEDIVRVRHNIKRCSLKLQTLILYGVWDYRWPDSRICVCAHAYLFIHTMNMYYLYNGDLFAWGFFAFITFKNKQPLKE